MSELSGGLRSPDEGMRAWARLLRSRRRTLSLTGQVALLLAATASAAALLRVVNAPSGAFIVQCFALGIVALAVRDLRPLRRTLPALSILLAAGLVLIVVLEALGARATNVPLEVAACSAILPILSVQIASGRRRALTVIAAGGAVVAAAAAAGMHGLALAQLATALAFVVAVALVAAQGLDAGRAHQEHRRVQLRRTALRERRLMQAREEMVANLSHDLRNPLAIALGFAEMAEDGDLAVDERAQALSGLRRSLCEMSQLVENVLDGSAEQAGACTAALEPLELGMLCEDALAATRILLRRRPVALSGAIDPGIRVVADRQRLVRVLGNLLSNACKFTKAGEIRLEATSSGHLAVIRVRDTGPGIAAEAIPHIFDRFRRAHHGGPAGAGLGLAIAQRLTERMGGALEVASEVGVGSTFTITLPLAAAERPQSVAA